MAFDYDKYIRPGKLPHIWCPGCGHGIVMKGLIRAIDTLGLEKNNTAIVSGAAPAWSQESMSELQETAAP